MSVTKDKINNYTGELVSDYISFNFVMNKNSLPSDTFNFISVSNISNTNYFSYSGFLAISFINNTFVNITSIKMRQSDVYSNIFSLYFDTYRGYMDIGEINTQIVKNNSLLSEYPVTISEDQSKWYITPNKLSLNNMLILNETLKLTFDSSNWKFQIPKNFFFAHHKNIFPKNGSCQVQLNGEFICECNSKYKENFPSFLFEFPNGNYIKINPKDYIKYDGSISNSLCFVSLSINYENDMFIGG